MASEVNGDQSNTEHDQETHVGVDYGYDSLGTSATRTNRLEIAGECFCRAVVNPEYRREGLLNSRTNSVARQNTCSRRMRNSLASFPDAFSSGSHLATPILNLTK